MSQENLEAAVAGMTSRLSDILKDLCICIEGKQTPKVQEETLARATKCVTSGTFGVPISLTEHDRLFSSFYSLRDVLGSVAKCDPQKIGCNDCRQSHSRASSRKCNVS